MMEIYKMNSMQLEQVVQHNKVIFPISRHRKEDGSLDIETNLKLWNEAMSVFSKTYLWEEGAPGYEATKTPLQENSYFVFVPSNNQEKKRGTIIVAHGGGFSWRTGCEGVNVAHYFHQRGYNVAILAYRLLPYSRIDAMHDMQRAIRMIRSKKEEWGLGEKICVMGFSAGAMLSANCATHWDTGKVHTEDTIEQFSCKPDAAVIGYGAMSAVSFPLPFGQKNVDLLMGRDIKERLYLAPEKNISNDTPPMFIWQTMSDDGRYGMNLAKALQDAEIPYELHIFQPGVHGLAMADGNNDLAANIPHITHWGELCDEWLQAMEF